jgi:hypothetical protein
MKASLTFPKWLCVGFAFLAIATLGSRAWMDVQQGTNGMERWSEDWLLQAGVMLLPSLYVVLLSLGGGMAVKMGHKFMALILYVGVGTFLFFTSTNNLDFLVNKTINKTEVEKAKVVAAQDIAAIQNQQVLDDRKEAKENLWRTYTTAKKPEDKAKALAEIEKFTEKPVPLKPLDVGANNKGAGDVLERWTGIKARTWAEAKTLALPIGFMVFEIVLLSLAISGWPRPGSDGQRQKGFSDFPKGNAANQGKAVKSVPIDDALQDLRLIHPKSPHQITVSFLKKRWGVTRQTIHYRLGVWERDKIIGTKKTSDGETYVSSVSPLRVVVSNENTKKESA